MVDMKDIKFPVIAFNQGIYMVIDEARTLTRCSAAGLKNGWFDGLEFVDVDNKLFKVKSARKIGSYRDNTGLFLSRKFLKVELAFAGEPKKITLDEIRKKVIKNLGGARSRGDIKEFKQAIEESGTTLVLAYVLGS